MDEGASASIAEMDSRLRGNDVVGYSVYGGA